MRRGLPVALIVACGVLAVPAAAPAATSPGKGLVHVVGPGHDAFYTGSPIVRVRAARGVRVTARLDGRGLRLHRRNGALVVRLRRSRLSAGRHHLNVEARKGRRRVRHVTRFYTAGRRRPALLRLAHFGRSGRPLAVTARLGHRHARLDAFLNGRRVHHLFERRGRRLRASLSASDGLRHGRNVLRVTAHLRNGDYAAAVRTAVLRRDRPLAGAGRDRPALTRRRVVLDGRRSRAARRGRLSYTWSLVRKPRGSRARLTRVHARRPVLRTDVRGNYRVRLTVAERRGRRAAGAAASTAADVMTVAAQPSADPIGVPIDTYAQSGGEPAIVVGGTPHTAFPAGGGFQVLVLDRTGPQGGTLGVLANEAVAFDSASQLSDVWEPHASESPLVVITGTPGSSITDPSAFNSEIAGIGAAPISSFQAGVSVVGIPGQAAGQAWVLAPFGAEDTTFSGISAYLSKDSTSEAALTASYVLAPSDYVSFSLGPASPNSETVVGCTEERPDPCTKVNWSTMSAPAHGFGLVVLDAYSLALESAAVYDATDEVSLGRLLTALQQASSEPTDLVLLKTFGAPGPYYSIWGDLSFAIGALGGNPGTFNTFNPINQQVGSQDYALVGGAGNKPQTADLAAQGLSMGGFLGRQPNWQFASQASDPLGSVSYELSQIAYQTNPSGTFPRSGGAYADAEADIAKALSCPPGAPQPCFPWPSVRSQYYTSEYWDPQFAVTWNAYDDMLDKIDYPRGAKYSPEQFSALKDQLETEFDLVDDVQSLFIGLYAPYSQVSGGTQADLQTIATDITSKLESQQNTSNTSQILATVSSIFSGIADAVGSLPGVGGIFGAFSTWLNIASIWTASSDNGTRLLLEVQSDANNIAHDLSTVQANAEVGLARLEQIMVSDYGKLKATAEYFDELDVASGQNFDTEWKLLAVAGRRTVYNAIMPPEYNAGISLGYPNPFRWLRDFSGDPGSLSAHYCELNMFTPPPDTITSALFAAPTFGSGDINAGILPQTWYLQTPYQAGHACD